MWDTEYQTDCDSQELAEKLKDAQPTNTRKTTSWAVSVFRRWAARRSHHAFVKPDLLDYGADVASMSRALFKFFSEVHTVEGKALTPSSLQVLRVGLQRHLTDHHEHPPDLSDNVFKKANEAFKAAKRRYALSGDNPQAGKQKQPIDPADQEKIRQYFTMPDTYEDPKKLQEFIYYMLSMHFGYRGSEIWHQLHHRNFKDGIDETGKACLTLDQAICEKNYQHTGPNSVCRRVIKITDDPDADVYMYTTLKMYIDRLDPRQEAFLAKPKTAAQIAKDPTGPWYVNAPVGVRTIAKIMPGISRKAQTSKRYTNHCVRHTLGTNMMRMGFPLPAIQSRLRLRSAATLSWYTGYRTADELTEETRTISAPLRGLQRPAPATNRGQQEEHVPQPSTSRGTGRAVVQTQPERRAVEEVMNLHQMEEPAAPVPMNVEEAGDKVRHQVPAAVGPPPRFGVMPLHLADLTRPPPPIPDGAIRRGNPVVPPTKVFSGSFYNCVFY